MTWQLLAGSFRYQKSRMVVATLAVVLGTSLVAALSILSMDIPTKAGSQLRAYGANVLILPATAEAEGNYIPESGLAYLEREKIAQSIDSYTPYLYSLVGLSGQKVVLAGTWLDAVRQTSSWWQVRGEWLDTSDDTGSIMVGVQIAQNLKLELGSEIAVKYGPNSHSFIVKGIVETGASEDSQLFVSLRAAQELSSNLGKVSLVQVSASSQKQPLSRLARQLEQGLPGTEVRVIGQIARAESQVLDKVRLLIALVAGLILLAACLAILSTMTTTLLERTREIGLMKALGAADWRIAWLFGAQALTIALGGGLVGYLLGYLLAQLVGHGVFGAAISPQPLSFLLTLAMAAVVTYLGSALPLRRAMKIDPAITLRGE